MNTTDLPSDNQAYQSLCEQGAQFPESNRHIWPMDGITYEHPTEGRRVVAVDHYALASVGKTYVGTPALGSALILCRAQVGSLTDLLHIVSNVHSGSDLIWGFSGYATPGYNYAIEGRAMRSLLAYLHRLGQRPGLVSDGGVSNGVLGLSGVLAAYFQIPSLGYAPLQGLGSIGPRTHLAAHKATYRQREELVGITADVLVCVGGGPGSIRECEIAVNAGGVVVLLALRDYGPSSLPSLYLDIPALRDAANDGRLIVCRDLRSIQSCVIAALRMARRVSLPSRTQRLDVLGQHLR